MIEFKEPAWVNQISGKFFRGFNYTPRNLKTSHISQFSKLMVDSIGSDELQNLFLRAGVNGFHSINHFGFVIRKNWEANWGFGIYFGSELTTAMHYGNNILIAEVDKEQIAFINAWDFAHNIENTLGNYFKTEFDKQGIDSHREQADLFYPLLKKIYGRKKKALFVGGTDDEDPKGQLIVFNTKIIKPEIYMEIKPDYNPYFPEEKRLVKK